MVRSKRMSAPRVAASVHPCSCWRVRCSFLCASRRVASSRAFSTARSSRACASHLARMASHCSGSMSSSPACAFEFPRGHLNLPAL
eukprot:scaffold64481_cov22-Tisochrysis_lutea.AAC.3